jgi:hypothetical protein
MNEVTLLIAWPALIVGCAWWMTTARRRVYWVVAGVVALIPALVGLVIEPRLPTLGSAAAWVLVVVFPISAAFFFARAESRDGAFRAVMVAAITYYFLLDGKMTIRAPELQAQHRRRIRVEAQAPEPTALNSSVLVVAFRRRGSAPMR